MNSRMLKIPRTPGLAKFQKSELATPLEEYAKCWNMNKAINPAMKSTKRGMYA